MGDSVNALESRHPQRSMRGKAWGTEIGGVEFCEHRHPEHGRRPSGSAGRDSSLGSSPAETNRSRKSIPVCEPPVSARDVVRAARKGCRRRTPSVTGKDETRREPTARSPVVDSRLRLDQFYRPRRALYAQTLRPSRDNTLAWHIVDRKCYIPLMYTSCGKKPVEKRRATIRPTGWLLIGLAVASCSSCGSEPRPSPERYLPDPREARRAIETSLETWRKRRSWSGRRRLFSR